MRNGMGNWGRRFREAAGHPALEALLVLALVTLGVWILVTDPDGPSAPNDTVLLAPH